MKTKKLLPGILLIDGKLATANLSRGTRVYGEELIDLEGTQYRLWNPYRSKLAAALMKGMKTMTIKPGCSVLYLGASTGTTCSHVSDIIGGKGIVYCIEAAERSMRDLLMVCEARPNMLPMLQDARNVSAYATEVGKADVLYQDISARDQDSILVANSALLRSGSYAYVAIKSQSIDVAKDPESVYSAFLARVSGTFRLVEAIDIMPYDKMHLFVVLEKL